ncbi:hypothetical protein BG004_005545 [Podila humilis]|nr:hypothetical protein BG004_005545 [Podila humilis]
MDDQDENMDVSQELAWQDLQEQDQSNRGHRSNTHIDNQHQSQSPINAATPPSSGPGIDGREALIHPFDNIHTIDSSDASKRVPSLTPGVEASSVQTRSLLTRAPPLDLKVPPTAPASQKIKNMAPPHPQSLDQQTTKSRSRDQNVSQSSSNGNSKSTHRTLSSVPLSRTGCSQPVVPVPPNLALPITRDTLRELDLFEIFKNPQLRHDIVFDPHLQFRPNFDGERGMIKKREADRFWREVELELNTRQSAIAIRRDAAASMISLAGYASSSSHLVQQQQQQKCPLPTPNLLPKLIDELREILLSLLPAPAPPPVAPDTSKQGQPPPAPVNPERALLASTLDPELLLQELDHGVLDVHGLFRYLGDSLKGHCAPMRDSFVESMVAAVVQSGEIVRGIRMCFEILELMKLDIANHQLRTLRPWLLDNSIDFEQKYFTEQLARGGSLQRTMDWFKRSWIRWEGVKQYVLGNAGALSTPSLSVAPSRRSSLAPPISPPVSMSSHSDLNVKEFKTPPHAALMAKRRPSLVTADIGENILDGVVNEGLLEMVLRPHGSVNTMPETFELDHYRLLSFHNDFQDLTILCTLLILFRQLSRNCWTQQDLIEIKKVVWLLLTDENANFGSNTNASPGSAKNGSKDSSQPYTSSSSGMKDIVIQIEFAARKVRERSANTAAATSTSRRPSLVPAPTSPTTANPLRKVTISTGVPSVIIPTPLPSPLPAVTPAAPPCFSTKPAGSPGTNPLTSGGGLSASDTNLLTSWLDNALNRNSTLYALIQKRLMIHFRRWLYLHSSSSMLILSASCASLASALSMSSGFANVSADSNENESEEEEEDMSTAAVTATPSINTGGSQKPPLSTSTTGKPSSLSSSSAQAQEGNGHANASTSAPVSAPAPELSAEETNKAAAEALASKLSFNSAEMEAHGLIGLEDEMVALLEKIRAVSEFNKKVYGTWYRDLVMQGRSENWLESQS